MSGSRMSLIVNRYRTAIATKQSITSLLHRHQAKQHASLEVLATLFVSSSQPPP